jgi:hypothetical protein
MVFCGAGGGHLVQGPVGTTGIETNENLGLGIELALGLGTGLDRIRCHIFDSMVRGAGRGYLVKGSIRKTGVEAY